LCAPVDLSSFIIHNSTLNASERSSAWLERVVWVHEVAGSNPVAPTILFHPPISNSPQLVQDLFTIFRAGENFIAWAKENRKTFFTNHGIIFNSFKTIVKKGDFRFCRDVFSGWHCHC
jgi:hypothetical protein